MGNILPPNRDIHEVYDLKVFFFFMPTLKPEISLYFFFFFKKKIKGSTVGRIVEVTEEQLASGKTPVLKDLNFKRKIVLGPKKRAEFFEQIQKDSTVSFFFSSFFSSFFSFFPSKLNSHCKFSFWEK